MSTKIDLTATQQQSVLEMLTTEMQQCGTKGCTARDGGPRHFSGYLDHLNNRFINNGCESRGRQLDPKTLAFKGSSHCACDTCF